QRVQGPARMGALRQNILLERGPGHRRLPSSLIARPRIAHEPAAHARVAEYPLLPDGPRRDREPVAPAQELLRRVVAGVVAALLAVTDRRVGRGHAPEAQGLAPDHVRAEDERARPYHRMGCAFDRERPPLPRVIADG